MGNRRNRERPAVSDARFCLRTVLPLLPAVAIVHIGRIPEGRGLQGAGRKRFSTYLALTLIAKNFVCVVHLWRERGQLFERQRDMEKGVEYIPA